MTTSPGGYFAHPGRPAHLEEQFGPTEQVLVTEVYDGYRGWQRPDGLIGRPLTTGMVRRLWADGYERVIAAAVSYGQRNLDVRVLVDSDPEALRTAP